MNAVSRGPEINMADVAARAGVSVATVSRALRGLPGVGEKTRDRILEIAEELAYVVSPEASRLSGVRAHRVGVVVPRTDVWFYGEMLGWIEPRLREAGLDVLIYQVKDPAQRAAFFRELPARRKVEAVILIALPMPSQEVARLDELGVEVVVAGGRIGDYPHVEIDDHAVAVTAVEHLLELGHRRIAMIRTTDHDRHHWGPDVHRLAGYRAATEAAGLAPDDDLVVSVEFTPEGGIEAIGSLLDLAEPPTAVLAFSDEIAFGVLEGARRRGVRVPEELSIVGIDDHPISRTVGLTTVRQDVRTQARAAADMAIALVSGERPSRSELVVAHDLVVRETTAPPAKVDA